jgi:hypothetical protein
MELVDVKKKIQERRGMSATRIVASTLAGITTAASVMHGCFEILQGNSAPGGLVFNAIGPGQRMWEYAALHAFTIVPSFFVTGVLSITLGLLATIWAVAFIDKKSGPWVMFLLSILLFLVGGGSGPLFIGSFASLIATRIGKPLTWWRRHLPGTIRTFFAQLWPGILIFYALLFLLSVETTIFGQPLNLLLDVNTTYQIVLMAGNVLLLFMLLSVLSAFAHDILNAEISGGSGE